MNRILEKFFIPYVLPGVCLGVGFVLTNMATAEARHQYNVWKWNEIRQQEHEQRNIDPKHVSARDVEND